MPTPSASESTPTDEYVREVAATIDADDPNRRMYLPGRRSFSQRTLSRIAPALLPTPQASDGDRGPDYARQRERVETHGSGGDDLTTTIAKLLPTPTAEDGERGRGGSGTDRLGTGTFEGEVRLLPTPQAADGDGGRQEKGAMGEGGGKRPSGQKATLPLPTAVAMRETISETPFSVIELGDQAALFDVVEELATCGCLLEYVDAGGYCACCGAHLDDPDGMYALQRSAIHGLRRCPLYGQQVGGAALLPTPVANPDNPGAGGELRAAVVHGEGRRNETGIDTLGRPNRGRAGSLLPTPTAADGDRSSEQGPRYYAGGGDNPTLLGAARRSEVSWGVYEKAIRRWEGVCGREAPAPTDEKGRLAPEFAEWMLGYDEGWFDVPGLKRTAKLRALGNSVQVQCGEVVGYWLGALVESGLLSS